jgi:hypothetical protein
LVALACGPACVDSPSEMIEDEDTQGEPIDTPCDGNPAAVWLTIDGPRPPAPLSKLPIVSWTFVHDTVGLRDAVARGDRYIELANGVYTADALGGGALHIEGQQLWAAEQGGARLQFGVQAGGNDHANDHRRHGDAELHHPTA